MIYPMIQNGSVQTPLKKAPLHTRATVATFAINMQTVAAVIFFVTVALFWFVPPASAQLAGQSETVELPDVGQAVSAPVKRPAPPQATAILRVSGLCQDGLAVFAVTNGAKKWAKRGYFRILDGETGQVVRERWLRLDAGQRATFRLPSYVVASYRYRIVVALANGSNVLLKSFRGRCPQPSDDTRAVRR